MPADPRAPSGAFPIWVPIQVRFGDTDALGHLNNAVYLTYLEVARVAYIEAVTGRPVGANPLAPSFVLAEARITYRSPVRLGEAVVVGCRVGWLGRTSFSMEYRVEAGASTRGPRDQMEAAAPTGGPGMFVAGASVADQLAQRLDATLPSGASEDRVAAASVADQLAQRVEVAGRADAPARPDEPAAPADASVSRAGAAGTGRLVVAALAETVQVMIDPATGAPLPISDELRRLVEAYEGRALPARPPSR